MLRDHRPTRGASADQRVIVFAAALAALGAVLLAATPNITVAPTRAWHIPFLVLTAAFALAEATALHVEIRKESHSLSLSGIPMMLGLLQLSPVMWIASYLLGSTLTLICVRRLGLLKTTWNICLFFAQGALAALIVSAFLGSGPPVGFRDWFVILSATLAADSLSVITVPLVIMAVEGNVRAELYGDVLRTQALAVVGGTFTVTMSAASMSKPSMALYAVAPLLGVAALLRTHGRLVQSHSDLEQLHGFTRSLNNVRSDRTLDAGLGQLVQVMRCMTAGLIIISHDPDEPSTLRSLVDDRYLDLDPGPLVELLPLLVSEPTASKLSMDTLGANAKFALRHLGAREMVAASVLMDIDRTAFLFVTDRLGVTRSFSSDEVRLFDSLARALSARLSNDHLVEQLEIQALHDPLTGLPNRFTFELALSEKLAEADTSGIVAMVDLDRFKLVNDLLGHDVGDQLLIEIANRLTRYSRSSDMVSRFGGDEFAIFLSGPIGQPTNTFVERLEEIHQRLVASAKLEGIVFEIGASIGVVQWPDNGTNVHDLLRRADAAMYDAKRSQLGLAWYDSAHDHDAPRLHELSLSIRQAIEEEELTIHLQPKIAVSDGRLVGAEALVRWTHPIHGPISPTEFMPLVDQAGMTPQLARIVLKHSMVAARELRRQGSDIPIAVNLTPRDLLDPSLPGYIERLLTDDDLDPSALIVEITEDAIIVDFDTSVAVLRRLRAMGIKVAIDDFGTGYSSLQHLHRLPCDQLKIDRSFVERLSTDASAVAIVRAATALAHELGLGTVAEGVEDQATLRIVAALGCQEIQGFHISRPLPPTDFYSMALNWSPTSFMAQLEIETIELSR